MPPQDYEEIDWVGSGAYGSVFKVRRLIDNEFLARKVVRRDFRSMTKSSQEIKNLTRINHPNIVRLKLAEEDARGRLWLYMEFCDAGSLFDYINEKNKETDYIALHKHELFVWKVALELGLAVSRCHYGLDWNPERRRYVYIPNWTPMLHRDIKLDNGWLDVTTRVFTNSSLTTSAVLLKTAEGSLDAFCVKLADFGTSYLLEDSVKDPSTYYAGTRRYWAPTLLARSYWIKLNSIQKEMTEVSRGCRIPWSLATDMWAVGCTLYGLLERDRSKLEELGDPPSFSRAEIYSAECPFPDRQSFQNELRDIIRGCLTKDPISRSSSLKLVIGATEGIKRLEKYTRKPLSVHPKLPQLQDLSDLPTLAIGTDLTPQQQLYSEHILQARVTVMFFLGVPRSSDDWAWAVLELAAFYSKHSTDVTKASECRDLAFASQGLAEIDSEGKTMLHRAAIHAREHVVEQLLMMGADLLQPDHSQNTALHYAVEAGNRGTVSTIIKRSGFSTLTPILLANRDGFLPSHLALIRGFSDIAKDLAAFEGAIILRNEAQLDGLRILLENERDAGIKERNNLQANWKTNKKREALEKEKREAREREEQEALDALDREEREILEELEREEREAHEREEQETLEAFEKEKREALEREEQDALEALEGEEHDAFDAFNREEQETLEELEELEELEREEREAHEREE